jgi:dTDP-4-dehydrorhamnose 3,5-epimerase
MDEQVNRNTLLEATIVAAKADTATVSSKGEPIRRLTHGVSLRRLVTHTDYRGSLTELYDTRWDFHPDPLVSSYIFTIRPGVVKGWNLHQTHEDRYVLLQGEMELVLYDPRPDSPTCGEVCTIVLSEYERCIVNIPINVWHADRNIGSRETVVMNFPTVPYDHMNPDKLRLPLDSSLIPHQFPENVIGG